MTSDTGVRLAEPRADAPAPPPVGIGPLGLARWAWRVLTSMRTALLLLFLLALAAVPGSVVPQRGIDAAAVAAFRTDHPRLAPWFERLSLFEVYASPWFSAIYLLLFISLAGCVLPRSRTHWQAMRARPPAAPRHLDRLPAYGRLTSTAAPPVVLNAAADLLRAERFRVDIDSEAGAVRAERGHLRETGNLLFHLALILLLVAVAAGKLTGYRATVLVSEGGAFSNTVSAYDTFSRGARFDERALAPFTVALQDLDVRYQEDGQQRGAPRSFRAAVTFTERPDARPQRATISVNHPLRVGGAKVFLIGNGYAPRVTVRDGNGDVAFSGPVPFLPRDANMTSTGVVKVPDALPAQIGLQGFFLPTSSTSGPVSLFPDARRPLLYLVAWKGDLGLDKAAQSVYRLDTSRMTQLSQRPLAVGDAMDLGPGVGSVSYDGWVRFASLTVARDRGGAPAFLAALLAIAGLMLSLSVHWRRVWVRARADGTGATVVEVAGLGRTEGTPVRDEVDRLAARLRADGPAAGEE